MRSGVRQRLAGLIVNQRLNVSRIEFDRLKATLTNCVRHGAASQNRSKPPDFRATCLGKISFVEMIHPCAGSALAETILIVWNGKLQDSHSEGLTEALEHPRRMGFIR